MQQSSPCFVSAEADYALRCACRTALANAPVSLYVRTVKDPLGVLKSMILVIIPKRSCTTKISDKSSEIGESCSCVARLNAFGMNTTRREVKTTHPPTHRPPVIFFSKRAPTLTLRVKISEGSASLRKALQNQ